MRFNNPSKLKPNYVALLEYGSGNETDKDWVVGQTIPEIANNFINNSRAPYLVDIIKWKQDGTYLYWITYKPKGTERLLQIWLKILPYEEIVRRYEAQLPL